MAHSAKAVRGWRLALALGALASGEVRMEGRNGSRENLDRLVTRRQAKERLAWRYGSRGAVWLNGLDRGLMAADRSIGDEGDAPDVKSILQDVFPTAAGLLFYKK
jgi:hypothetical protein